MRATPSLHRGNKYSDFGSVHLFVISELPSDLMFVPCLFRVCEPMQKVHDLSLLNQIVARKINTCCFLPTTCGCTCRYTLPNALLCMSTIRCVVHGDILLTDQKTRQVVLDTILVDLLHPPNLFEAIVGGGALLSHSA